MILSNETVLIEQYANDRGAYVMVMAVLIIFLVILQTVINMIMVSIGGQGGMK